MLEAMAPEVEREKQDARHAEEFLRMLEATCPQAGQKLKSARDELNSAQRDMGRAAQQRDVADQWAEAANVKAKLPGPTRPEQDDRNIAEALRSASGQSPAATDISERLAALRGRQATT
jgi:hypothetical protein